VTESGGPAAGGSLGGGGPAPPPSFCPSPWLLLRSSCHPEPPCPVEAGPALILPTPFTTRKLAPVSIPGQGRKGRGWTRERGVGLCPPPSQDPQNKATDSVILLQFCSFSSLSTTRCHDCTGAQGEVSGQAGVPERVRTWHASEATETLPHRVLPHGAVFRDS